MSRILRRPMFRRGGSTNEGIMDGLVDRQGYDRGTNPWAQEAMEAFGSIPRPKDRSLSEMLIGGGLNLVSGAGAGEGLMANIAKSYKGPSERFFETKRAAGDTEHQMKMAAAKMGLGQKWALEQARAKKEDDVSKYKVLAKDLMRDYPNEYPDTPEGRKRAFDQAINIYERSPGKTEEEWINTFAAKNIGQIGQRGKHPRPYAEWEYKIQPDLNKQGKDAFLLQDYMIKRGKDKGGIATGDMDAGNYYFDLRNSSLHLFDGVSLTRVDPVTLEVIPEEEVPEIYPK